MYLNVSIFQPTGTLTLINSANVTAGGGIEVARTGDSVFVVGTSRLITT